MPRFSRTVGVALAGFLWAGIAVAQDKPGSTEGLQSASVTGILKSVESKPNVPGARCGYHYELLVASANGTVRVMIYDRTAPIEKLDALIDREVEIALDGGNIARSVRPAGAKSEAGDKLANLSSVKHC